MRTADEIRQEVQRIREISTLPQVMRRVMEIVVDESSSAQDLGREIAHDQSLTAKVLKIVNSAFYGFYRRISSVSEAVVILGYNEVRSIAMTVSVFDLFGHSRGAGRFDRVKLWEHAIASGTMADIIRQHCCRFEQSAFVAGLLHDVGKVVLDQYFAPEWNRALVQAEEDGRPLVAVEQDRLGITHAEIGYLLSERWNLPPPIGQAILTHHQEPNLATSAPLEGLTYIANAFVKERGIGFGGDDVVWPVSDEARQVVGLEDGHLPKINTALMKRMSSISAMLGYFGERPSPGGRSRR